MSRIKWSKLLVGTAIIGAAVAGGIAYFNKNKKSDECLDDDFDDFDDNFDKDDDFDDVVTFHKTEREYVSIPKDAASVTSAKEGSQETTFPSSEDSQLTYKDAGQLQEAVETEVSEQSANVEKKIQEINSKTHGEDDRNAGVNNITRNNLNTGYKDNFGYKTNSNHKRNYYYKKNNNYNKSFENKTK